MEEDSDLQAAWEFALCPHSLHFPGLSFLKSLHQTSPCPAELWRLLPLGAHREPLRSVVRLMNGCSLPGQACSALGGQLARHEALRLFSSSARSVVRKPGHELRAPISAHTQWLHERSVRLAEKGHFVETVPSLG